MPIKPRGERGNRWLRYLFAALLLAVVVGGSAFAVTRLFGDDDDDPNVPAQTTDLETPESELAATDPTPTEAGDAEPTEAAGDAEPTATEEPAEDEEAAPTEEPDQAEPTEETAAAADTGEEEDASSERDALSYLPEVEELDGAWVVSAEGDRTREEVAAALGEGGDEALTGFRWRENPYRDFTREGQAADDETFFVSVSVHRFGNAEGASEALAYFSDVLAAGGVYQQAAEVPVGDASVALAGSQDGANLYALYVQDGNYVIRLGGSSLVGDPAPFVDSVAAFIVDQ
jgi:hypothetical protein